MTWKTRTHWHSDFRPVLNLRVEVGDWKGTCLLSRSCLLRRRYIIRKHRRGQIRLGHSSRSAAREEELPEQLWEV